MKVRKKKNTGMQNSFLNAQKSWLKSQKIQILNQPFLN